MIEKGVGKIPKLLTAEIVNYLYDLGTEYLKTRFCYVFQNDKLRHNNWVIAAWMKYLSRSVMIKKGTDNNW